MANINIFTSHTIRIAVVASASRCRHKHTNDGVFLFPVGQVVPLFAVELLQRFNLGQKEEKTSFLPSNSEGKMTLED